MTGTQLKILSNKKLRRKRIKLLLKLSKFSKSVSNIDSRVNEWHLPPMRMALTAQAFEVGVQAIKYTREWRKLRYGEIYTRDAEGMASQQARSV